MTRAEVEEIVMRWGSITRTRWWGHGQMLRWCGGDAYKTSHAQLSTAMRVNRPSLHTFSQRQNSSLRSTMNILRPTQAFLWFFVPWCKSC